MTAGPFWPITIEVLFVADVFRFIVVLVHLILALYLIAFSRFQSTAPKS